MIRKRAEEKKESPLARCNNMNPTPPKDGSTQQTKHGRRKDLSPVKSRNKTPNGDHAVSGSKLLRCYGHLLYIRHATIIWGFYHIATSTFSVESQLSPKGLLHCTIWYMYTFPIPAVCPPSFALAGISELWRVVLQIFHDLNTLCDVLCSEI